MWIKRKPLCLLRHAINFGNSKLKQIGNEHDHVVLEQMI